MLFDDAIADREPETGAAVLGREERREDMRQVFFANSDSFVRDVHPNQPTAVAVP